MKSPIGEDLTNVFIVEDHNLVRRAMGQMIQRTPGLSLCGEAATAEAALAKIPACKPQLVLIDISLPGMNGIDLIRVLHEKYPSMLLLALSGHDESVYGALAIHAGARGYVMKGKREKVMEAIRHISNDHIYVSDKLRAILDGTV